MPRYIDADELREQIDNYPFTEYCDYSNVIDMIDYAPTVDVAPVKHWISVKDRLPEPKTWAIVYIEYPSPVLELERGIQKTNNIKKLFYDGKGFYNDYGNITHWMPLPEPPKGE